MRGIGKHGFLWSRTIIAYISMAGISAANGDIHFKTTVGDLATSRNEVQESVLKFDEWELAGDEKELTGDSTGMMIFGCKPPTLQEAQEACSDLNEIQAVGIDSSYHHRCCAGFRLKK